MPHSTAQSHEVACPHCHHAFTHTIWLIVDSEERPDLLAHIQAGTLHTATCPHCHSELGQADAPLLVYHPSQQPALLFSPAQQTSQEEDGAHFQGLLALLQEQTRANWTEEWLQANVQGVARPLLPVQLGATPNEAMLRQMAQQLRDLSEEDPELAAQLAQLLEASEEEIIQMLATLVKEKGEDFDDDRIKKNVPQTQGIGLNITPELQPLLHQIIQLTEPQQMEERIILVQQALQHVFHTNNLPLRGTLQLILGDSLYQNPHGSRAENLEQAINCYEEARQILSLANMPVERAHATTNLATAYRNRIYGERGENIEQAIQLYEDALQVRTRATMPVEWATTTMNLAISYYFRAHGEQIENIERAICLYEKVLQVRTRATMPHEWADTTVNLANVYADRIKGEPAKNIDQAIYLYEEALQEINRATMPAEWAIVTMNVATAYKNRIYGERAENIEQAICLYQEALQEMTSPAMSTEWATTIMNLANAYYSRIRGERVENIEQAIHLYEEALQVRTRATLPIEWAEVTMNLASAYSERIRGERAENIEQAIHLYNEALQVMTRTSMPQDWIMATMNLGNAYAERIRGKRATNIEYAIRLIEEALEEMPCSRMPAKWATATTNLAVAYKNRLYEERADNIERAIGLFEEALQVRLRTTMPVEWATTTMNLAVAYNERIWGNRAENIEYAIRLFEETLQEIICTALPIEWAGITMNLAIAYRNRIHGERAENIEQAITLYREALTIFALTTMPSDHQKCQYNLGDLHFEEGQWEQSFAAYEGAIAANKLLLGSASTREGQLAEVGEVSTLFARTAYALFQLGRFGEALVQLDRGKARLLAQAVGQEEADVALLTDEEQAQFHQARATFRELQLERQLPPNSPGRRADSELSPLQEAALNELNATIARLRAAHPDFMPEGLKLAELLQLIPVGGALIAPVVTSHGGGVLVVPHGVTELTPAHYLPLPTLSEAQVQAWVIGTEETPGWLRIYLARRSSNDLTGWEAILQEVNQQLLTPVRERLAALGIPHGAELLLMPQGGLGLLPLHQFWLDEYTVRYAPSGYAVQASLRREAEGQRSGGAEGRLLAVVNPTADLPFTPYEGAAVANLFGGEKTLYHEGAATRAPILEALGQHDYLHFSCHGNFAWGDSDQTGLVLANGERLTLRDILTHRLRPARLVTLSACETGMTDVTQAADEFLGLPAAFLQAGAIGVVGTLWAVNDLSTTLLMERFYTLHLGGMAPAQALRQAQIWLRSTSAEELNLVPLCIRAYEALKQRGDKKANDLAKQIEYYRRNPKVVPFAHPYFWAGFTFSGV